MNKPILTLEDACVHISGYHNPKRIDPATGWYDDEPCYLVGFQCGFEMNVVAVYGHGLCDGDAMAAAEEWLAGEEWSESPEADYCERIR